MRSPADWPQRAGVPIISATHAANRTIALVRLDSVARVGPGLDQAEPTFDELVLGYLTAAQPLRDEVPA
ncbi:MAG: hypothetical protein ACJ74O_18120 [Frankiaceae bacterium]